MRSSEKPCILIVDDLIDNLALLQVVLEAEGYGVDTASDGRTAIAKIQASPPNLVLLDIMMPDMNGIEVTRCLRQSTTSALIPILLTTANQDVSVSQALEAGANGFIYKPIDFEELLATIKRWCG